MPRLYIEDDAGNVRIQPIEGDELSIGRAEDNWLVLPDRNVSRHHARLRAINGRFFVEDAGARYGLFLNGNRVHGRGEVRSGDLIGIGDYKLKILPSEGEAEVVVRSRKGTAPDLPAIVEQPTVADVGETSPDTSLISLKEMERVARQGWPSDFEGRDEVAHKKSMARRLVILAVLGAIAALLVAAYIWVSQPTEIELTAPARVAHPASGPSVPTAPSPPPAARVEPAEEPSMAPPEKPVQPPPTPEVSPAPAPSAAPPVRAVVEKPRATEPARPRETTRAVAVVEPKPSRTATPAPASQQKPAQTGDDIVTAIEAALQAGRLGEAEGLLAQCRGSACARPWKRLGDEYLKGGQPRQAISAYEKAVSLTRDANLRSRIQQKIDAIRAGL